ncbi:hypothetical protein BJ166DRAFT_602722 [Pestalotiopsis sp. NC0098]|nr:hypothetical protein BJ166DRAFT_602722 [Pestalotiopsis sp. NC0098]
MDDARSMASTAAAPAAQSIPLICSICPKTSKFSDVSHLLTHIASKGHLSNMFKLDIAKATEVDAQRRLDEYQAWFERYNIRGLLQTRSENRIQKNSGGRGRSASRGGSQSVSLRGGGNSSMVSRNKTGRNDVARDKRSGQRLVDNSSTANYAMAPTKYNPQDGLHHVSNFSAFPNVNAQQPWQPGHSAQQWPPLPNWNGAYFGHGFQQDLEFGIDMPIRDEDQEEDNNAPEVSSTYEPSDVEDGDDDSSNNLRSEDTVDTTVLEEDVPVVPEVVDDDDNEQKHFRKYLKGDISKLEGVGGFDAAPEDQRKRRNQKKDPSVLVHMEASSRAVRTIEQVTDLNFNHVRWRDVYDEPSVAGSEDDEDDIRPPKKAKHNTPVRVRRNVGKATRGVRVKVEENTSRESSVAPAARVTRGMSRQRGRTRQQYQPPQASTPRTASAEPAEPSEGSTIGSLVARDSNSSSSNGTSLSSYAGVHDEEIHRTGAAPIELDDQQGINVYRDSTPGGTSDMRPTGAPTNFLASHRRRNGALPRLALRPTNANANVPLLSPTPLFKGHGPARLFSGKENSHGGFSGGSSAAINPYLNSPESLGEGSFNPLCVQNQDSRAIRGYPWGDNVKPLATGFQPINNSSGLNSLNGGSQDSEVYRCTPHDGAGEYDI